MFVSVKCCSHSQTYTRCRCCRIYEVQMYFRSKVNRGVSETWVCPTIFIRRDAWVWLTRFAKKTCLMKLEVYFVMPFYVLFFFQTLWKVICWIKCKLSFPDNWSSYVVNVILLLKGFYSMLCAGGCPFPWRHRTLELPPLGLDFTPALMGTHGPGLGNERSWARR